MGTSSHLHHNPAVIFYQETVRRFLAHHLLDQMTGQPQLPVVLLICPSSAENLLRCLKFRNVESHRYC